MGRVDPAVTSGAGTGHGERGATSVRVRSCPVCSSERRDTLYTQRFEPFDAGSITDSYDVVACRSCGMCFASGLPADERFADYYAQSSKYDLSGDGATVSSFEADRFREEADFIATNVSDHAVPVLDIGTATGALLVALRDRGFTNLHGVEPSPDAVRKARDEHGLDVRVGDAQAARAWGRRFGVVTLVAVLEHLVDPANALRETAQLLTPDGALYLLVPDASRFKDHVDAPFQEFSVEHINYFTPSSFRNLLSSVGLDVIRERQTVLTVSDDATGPALEVLCRPTSALPPVIVDRGGVDDVRRYVAASAAKEAGILERISALAAGQESVYVWGTGTNALHLLASSRLADCNIRAFIDSNPHYAGRRLADRPVMAPQDLPSVDAPILVASAVSQSSIASAARERFGPDVPLILLY